ncbi:hypothetical protein C8R43DRAFT_125800 [Mycena crocata]|nr:hypothetical protein C8R43DRAFT_125800 [Mycena crocata]
MSGSFHPRRSGRDDLAPPPYSAPSHGVEHRYSVLDKSRKEWGLFTIASAARSSRSTPLYYQDDSVQGAFDMEADKGDSVRSITVSISGSIVTGTMVDDTSVFLHLSVCLWSHKTSPARVGHCHWPFSIPLPSEVTVTERGRSSSNSLPESFLERHTRVSVLYEISVVVARGFLRPDVIFKTRFRYVPCTQPDPPSALRQRAYAMNTALRGPRVDPAGWATSVTAMAHGHVFMTRQAVVQCTLSLATPLCYTRGSVLPCWLVLESGDADALALFSDPSALDLRLQRRVRFRATALVTAMQSTNNHSNSATTQTVVDVATAVWWPQPAEDATPYTRTLEGEIRLPVDLAPSAEMGVAQFSIDYTVDLFPSSCIGFSAASPNVLLSTPVRIATMYPADVSRPIVYAPPSYENPNTTPRRTDAGDAVTYTQISGLRMR